jgi:hypothetical protein
MTQINTEDQAAFKKITENEKYLEFLFNYKGNVELFQKVKLEFRKHDVYSKHSFIHGVTKDNVENLVSLKFIEKYVYDLLQTVFMFSSQQIKCANYAKSLLKSCSPTVFVFLKPVLVECLNDRRRFDTKLSDLQYLIKEIETLEHNNLQSVEFIKEPMQRYFLGKDSIPLDDSLKAYLSVRGLLKSEAEKVKEYISKNSEEILNQLRKKFIDEITPLLKALPPPHTETKTDKLKAPVLGLFCSLINKIGIDKKDETESATVYCERICDKFKLPYTDRVRQNYNVNETKKLIQELTEKVLPLIDNETKILVQKYLDSKQPPKQNLYA